MTLCLVYQKSCRRALLYSIPPSGLESFWAEPYHRTLALRARGFQAESGGLSLPPNYRPALELAQRNLRSLAPETVAARAGVDLISTGDGSEYRLRMLSREYRVPFPECLVYEVGSGSPAGVSPTLVALHYLITADGSPVRHEWVPFRVIPGGGVYVAAFRRRSIEPLLTRFGGDPAGLHQAALTLGGTAAGMGDASYAFDALPRLPMACVLWLGDEEQGAEANILFDAGAPSYLPTEDLAVLAGTLAYGLIRAGGAAS